MAADANIDALVTFYQTKVTALTDDLRQLKAQVALDRFSDAAYAYKAFQSRQVTSRSIAGQYYVYTTPNQAKQMRDFAEAELTALLGLGGGTSYVDLSGRANVQQY